MLRKLFATAGYAVALTMLNSAVALADPASNKALVERAFTALQAGDVNTLNALFSPDGPSHAPDGKVSKQGGPHTDLKDACPMCAKLHDRHIGIDMILAADDLVAVRSIWSGNYVGDVRDVHIDGQPVTIVYFNIYRIKDGRIVENWFARDSLNLATQLGFMITPSKTLTGASDQATQSPR